MKKLLVVFVIVMLLIAGCKQSTPAAEAVEEEQDAADAPSSEEDTQSQDEAVDEEPTATPAYIVPTPLPIDPLNLKFETPDGVELDGEFWAPTYTEAPVVVLMHQYPMDHNIEWVALAPWLQNRGLVPYIRGGGEPWTDPSWFSPMIDGVEFGVFTFTFRNCLGGCSDNSVESREEWIVDAVTAIESAVSFKTVDPSKVIVVGTSIGADAAVDACQRLLEGGEITCTGVVTLSPGSYLGVPYADAVSDLLDAGIPVKCIAAEGDTLSADTCASVEGEGYESIITPDSVHGIRLFDPSLPIDLTAYLQNWLIDWAYTE